MAKTDNEILKLLNETPLTLIEIAEKLEKKPKVVFRSLRRLFQKGKICNDPNTRRYMLVNKEVP